LMKSVSSLVDSLWSVLELDRLTPRNLALDYFRAVAGDQLYGMCAVEGFSGSTLLIRAFNPGAAMELRYRSSEILSYINNSAGTELFDTLKVLFRPPRGRER
jgi:hypothetical protein